MAQDGADAGQGRTMAEHCGGGGCLRTWAPLIGALISARRSAARTICVTAARVSGRTGASTVVNTSGVRNGGLLWRR